MSGRWPDGLLAQRQQRGLAHERMRGSYADSRSRKLNAVISGTTLSALPVDAAGCGRHA